MSKFRKHIFVEHLCAITFICSIEKDFKVTTQDSFNFVSLQVKLEIKCIQSSRREKFHKQPVVVLLKDVCSVKHILYSIFSFTCGQNF